MDKINLAGPIGCLANEIREYKEEKGPLDTESVRYKCLEKVIQNYMIAVNILVEADTS